MRCVAFCTAESYKLPAIAGFFKSQGYVVRSYRKMLYLIHPVSLKEMVIFGYGCLVTWGFTHREEQELLENLKPFSIDLLEQIETSYFVFKYSDKTAITTHQRFNTDIITLESNSPRIKLAISYGLAQSVQLGYYEVAVQRQVARNAGFFTTLAKSGKINLSRRELSKRIGDIFMLSSQVNLNSEYLGEPEYFWEYSSWEIYYGNVAKFLDIAGRVKVLNYKLNVLHELFDMMISQLQHSHSSFLEMIIILLIFVEIVISLLFLH